MPTYPNQPTPRGLLSLRASVIILAATAIAMIAGGLTYYYLQPGQLAYALIAAAVAWAGTAKLLHALIDLDTK